MPEEKQGETPEVPKAAETVVPEPPKAAPGATLEELQAKLAELEKSVTNKTEENVRIHKKLEAFEKAEQERKEAELSEMEKLQKRLAEREAELKKLQLDEQKRTIAAKVGLPDKLALRIQGETPEDMEKDAKEILESLPKPEKVKTMSPTQPGVGAQQGETAAQKKARLMGVPTMDNIDLLFGIGGGLVEEE